MNQAGCAAVHIEDQVFDKRCGHRPNKTIVPISEMRDRLKVAIDSKLDDSFFIMARTDSIASEGIDGAIKRCKEYLDEGVDGIYVAVEIVAEVAAVNP